MSGLTFILVFGTYKQGHTRTSGTCDPRFPRVGGRGQKIFENWHGSPSKTAMNQLREEKPVAFILRYYTKLPYLNIQDKD